MPRDSHPTLRFLPVGLDVRGRPCLVVGGGSVGTRKALTLARAGADVTVISPTVTQDLAEQIKRGCLRWVEEPFREEHLGSRFLVVAATDDEELNANIVQGAARSGALVCDASSGDRSQLIFGALFANDEVTVAVFTDGRDPAHARRTRDQIAGILGSQRSP